MKEHVQYKAAKHAGLNPGGDCGPACLAGLTGYSVQEIYDLCFRGKIDGTCYDHMYAACWKLYSENKFTWIDTELPTDSRSIHHEFQRFGKPSWENFREWTKKAHYMTRSAGCAGIVQINMFGDAFGDRKHQLATNHWALVVDAVYDKDANASDLKVTISCPTRGEYTIEAFEFLMNYGGYNAIWVCPKKAN
jgi:hypothetical protein